MEATTQSPSDQTTFLYPDATSFSPDYVSSTSPDLGSGMNLGSDSGSGMDTGSGSGTDTGSGSVSDSGSGTDTSSGSGDFATGAIPPSIGGGPSSPAQQEDIIGDVRLLVMPTDEELIQMLPSLQVPVFGGSMPAGVQLSSIYEGISSKQGT